MPKPPRTKSGATESRDAALRASNPGASEPADIRPQYEALGVDGFYAEHGATYRNPHEATVKKLLETVALDWTLNLESVLDLACGSGEVTLALRALGATVTGADPYTGAAYFDRTGNTAEALSFEDIAGGALEGRAYSLVVCSFALHLAPVSRLPLVAFRLAQVSPALLILTPHKRPEIKAEWGWTRQRETILERVRARLYRSQMDRSSLANQVVSDDAKIF
jgi:SAM-dependent methyltransferase